MFESWKKLLTLLNFWNFVLSQGFFSEHLFLKFSYCVFKENDRKNFNLSGLSTESFLAIWLSQDEFVLKKFLIKKCVVNYVKLKITSMHNLHILWICSELLSLSFWHENKRSRSCTSSQPKMEEAMGQETSASWFGGNVRRSTWSHITHSPGNHRSQNFKRTQPSNFDVVQGSLNSDALRPRTRELAILPPPLAKQDFKGQVIQVWPV